MIGLPLRQTALNTHAERELYQTKERSYTIIAMEIFEKAIFTRAIKIELKTEKKRYTVYSICIIRIDESFNFKYLSIGFARQAAEG